MKLTGLLLLVLILLGCNPVSLEEKARKRDDSIKLHYALLPEAEKRKFFDTICDKLNTMEIVDSKSFLKHFFNTYYPADSIAYKNYDLHVIGDMYAANEDLINPEKIKINHKWFRLYVYPCFYNPFILKLEYTNNSYTFTYKLLSQANGYSNTTELEYNYRMYDTLSVHSLFNYIDSTNVLIDHKKYENCRPHDYTLWSFEYINKKKYKKSEKINPEMIGNCSTYQDYELAILCIKIIENSPVYKILKDNYRVDIPFGNEYFPYRLKSKAKE